MAFSLIRGTIHESLMAFDVELHFMVRTAEFRKRNGVVVSIPITDGLQYFTAVERITPQRSVTVIAAEDKTVVITCKVGDDEVAKGGVKYPMIFVHNKEILDFLIDGTTPTFTFQE